MLNRRGELEALKEGMCDLEDGITALENELYTKSEEIDDLTSELEKLLESEGDE